jgi:ligand-binding SRPBCC domain-containing protein
MSHLYTLKQVNKLPVGIETAWSFFADPANLPRVNPPHLDLKIDTDIEGEVQPGQLIKIKLKPILGIGVSWVSKITHVERYKLFVDEQVTGPFGFWQHQHHFKEVDGGTEVTDLIYYKMPYRNLGELAAPFVRKQLHKSFAYRQKKISQCLG